MSEVIVFIHAHGRAEILEAELSAAVTLGELHEALAERDSLDAEAFIFIDEAEDHEQGERHAPLHRVKHGSRIHVSRCRRIATTVNFLEMSKTHDFPPGTRVRAVKEWAVHSFEMKPKDAAEHVLQLCNSTERPPTDTPLNQLVRGHDCALCFDLVPEKRVEG